jgi:hypothetical protein
MQPTPVAAPGIWTHHHGITEDGNVISTGNDRWMGGVAFTPLGCDTIHAHGGGCFSSLGEKDDAQGCTPVATFYPYVLESLVAWSSVDMAADPKDRAREHMEVGTSAVLERLMAAGVTEVAAGTPLTSDGFPYGTGTITGRMGTEAVGVTLADAADLGDFDNVLAALGWIEARLMDASDHVGGGGTILMSPYVAAQLSQQIKEHDGRLYSEATGNPIIVGNFPMDRIYAVTGGIDVYLGPIEIRDLVERATNEYLVQVERLAMAVWNPCAAFSVGYDSGVVLPNPPEAPIEVGDAWCVSQSWFYRTFTGAAPASGEITDDGTTLAIAKTSFGDPIPGTGNADMFPPPGLLLLNHAGGTYTVEVTGATDGFGPVPTVAVTYQNPTGVLPTDGTTTQFCYEPATAPPPPADVPLDGVWFWHENDATAYQPNVVEDQSSNPSPRIIFTDPSQSGFMTQEVLDALASGTEHWLVLYGDGWEMHYHVLSALPGGGGVAVIYDGRVGTEPGPLAEVSSGYVTFTQPAPPT